MIRSCGRDNSGPFSRQYGPVAGAYAYSEPTNVPPVCRGNRNCAQGDTCQCEDIYVHAVADQELAVEILICFHSQFQ